jgi:acylphosphatase
VFFRASTQRKARQLGLTGYAINRPDGSVTVAARGESEALDELAAWLEKGPPGARVDQVTDFSPSDGDWLSATTFETG